jgi:hypothetical protein
MAATDPLYLEPPSDEDLATALRAWREGLLSQELDAGSPWCRILRAASAEEALEFARVCYPSGANNRFSPVRSAGVIVPAAYAGDRPETVAWEVILRNGRHKGIRRVPEHETRDRYLVEATLAKPLSVLDLRRPQIENLVAEGKHSPRLSAAPDFLYDRTRLWAQRLIDHIPGVDGILYESHQVSGDCLIVFADKTATIFERAAEAISVTEEPIRGLLRREAAKVNAYIDFGDEDPTE